MEELLEKLESILNKELSTHESLLQTANLFNKAIRESDIAALQQYTTIHDEQSFKIEKLEEQRIDCSNTIALKLGIKSESPKLSMVLEKVSVHWAEKLKKIQCSLKAVLHELSKINASNKILLEEGLKYINTTVKMMQKPEPKFSQYGIRGASSNPSPGRNFINRIA